MLWPFYLRLRTVPSRLRNLSPAKAKGRPSGRLHSDAQVSIRAKKHQVYSVPTRTSEVMTCLARDRVGVLNRTRGQVRDEWSRSGHGRRFMESAFYSEHSRLSPGLCVIDVLNNGRSGGLTSPRGAHRRISQWTQLKLLEAQKSKFKRIVSVRWLLRQHRAWRSCGLKGTTCPSATGFPEWTFTGGKVMWFQ